MKTSCLAGGVSMSRLLSTGAGTPGVGIGIGIGIQISETWGISTPTPMPTPFAWPLMVLWAKSTLDHFTLACIVS